MDKKAALTVTLEAACSNSIGTSFWMPPSVCAGTGFFGLLPSGARGKYSLLIRPDRHQYG